MKETVSSEWRDKKLLAYPFRKQIKSGCSIINPIHDWIPFEVALKCKAPVESASKCQMAAVRPAGREGLWPPGIFSHIPPPPFVPLDPAVTVAARSSLTAPRRSPSVCGCHLPRNTATPSAPICKMSSSALPLSIEMRLSAFLWQRMNPGTIESC